MSSIAKSIAVLEAVRRMPHVPTGLDVRRDQATSGDLDQQGGLVLRRSLWFSTFTPAHTYVYVQLKTDYLQLTV